MLLGEIDRSRKKRPDRRNLVLSQLLEGNRVHVCPGAPNPNIWRLLQLGYGRGESPSRGKKREDIPLVLLTSPSWAHEQGG